MPFVSLIASALALVVLLVLVCGPGKYEQLIILTYVYMIWAICRFVLDSFRRKAPCNIFLLGYFTILESIAIAFAVAGADYGYKTVGIAFGATVVIVLVFTLFAFQVRINRSEVDKSSFIWHFCPQTKYDITKWGGILFLMFVVFCILGLVWMLVGIFVNMDPKTYNIVELLYASVGILIFVGLLIYDTQLLLGGDHKYAISPEDYVMGALSIYLDIINLFLLLLRLISAIQNLSSD